MPRKPNQPVVKSFPALAALALWPGLAVPALASSEDAWQDLRAAVHDACAALAPDQGETVIEVNPFGSDSFGAALLITTLQDGGADRYVCIYDKAAKTAEMTAPFTPPEPIAETMAEPDGTIEVETVPHTEAELLRP